MPNPTTIHDEAQAIKPLEIGSLFYEPWPIDNHIEVFSLKGNPAESSVIYESDATKLVAMILETFPEIREQFNKSKP